MAKRLALSFATLLALCLLLEIATRILSNIDPAVTVADPVIGRRYVADFADRVYVPEASRYVFLRFHRDGFRGPDREYEKPAGAKRVAVVGDSFVLGAGIDEEDTLVARLEKRLADWDPTREWQVMNFGVSGSSTGQELAVYREVVRRYEPDVVICLFAVINDLADSSPRMTSTSAVYFDLDEEGELRRLPVRQESSGWLNRHSRFYIWQKLALRKLRLDLREKAGVVKPGKWIFSTDDGAGELAHAWQLLEKLLETFAREVEADGSRFVLAVVPAPEQIYDDRWDQVLANAREHASRFDRRHPDRRLSRIASRLDVPLVTMDDAFRASAPSATLAAKDEWLFLRGIGHLNEAGNRVAADVLFRALTAKVLEPEASKGQEPQDAALAQEAP